MTDSRGVERKDKKWFLITTKNIYWSIKDKKTGTKKDRKKTVPVANRNIRLFKPCSTKKKTEDKKTDYTEEPPNTKYLMLADTC